MNSKTISICSKFVIAALVIVGLNSCFTDEFEDKKATATFKMIGSVTTDNADLTLDGIKAVAFKQQGTGENISYQRADSITTGVDGKIVINVTDAPIDMTFLVEISDTKTPKRFENLKQVVEFKGAIFLNGKGWWEGTCERTFGPLKLTPATP